MVTGWIDLIDQLGSDPSLIELAIALPNLTSHQLAMWLASLVLWRLLFARLEDLATFYTRRSLAWVLFRSAVLVKPRRI